MKQLHIIGGKGHGKTTVVLELVRSLTERGRRIGTIKRTGRPRDLDAPGKDSRRHREAGGEPSAILAGDQVGLFLDAKGGDPYRLIEAHFHGCDLVIVEGGAEAVGPKLEVWRAGLGTLPIASEPGRTDIKALITDDDPGFDNPPRLSRSALASWIDPLDHWIARGASEPLDLETPRRSPRRREPAAEA